MVASGTPEVEFAKNGGHIRIQTLAGLYESGSTFLGFDNRPLSKEDIEKIRVRWLSHLDKEVMPVRNAMHAQMGAERRNVHLGYTSERLHEASSRPL